MVFIPQIENAPVLEAFLLTDLSVEQLDKIHAHFERGSGAKFHRPFVNLFISSDAGYHGKSPAFIRRDRDNRNKEGPFLLIDSQTPETESVLYVDTFASQDQVEDGEAASTEVLWTIRTKTMHIPLMWANLDCGNMDIVEALDGLGVEFPIEQNYEQREIYETGVNVDEETSEISSTLVVAWPDEIEESRKEEDRRKFGMDAPEKVVRLKEDVARKYGLVSEWWVPVPAKPERDANGTVVREYPEECVELQVNFDPEFQWPPYPKLEGSL